MQLYQNRGTWLNRLHPCTMAVYALTAILLPLLVGKRWLFVVTILCSLALLWKGVFPSTSALWIFDYFGGGDFHYSRNVL